MTTTATAAVSRLNAELTRIAAAQPAFHAKAVAGADLLKADASAWKGITLGLPGYALVRLGVCMLIQKNAAVAK